MIGRWSGAGNLSMNSGTRLSWQKLSPSCSSPLSGVSLDEMSFGFAPMNAGCLAGLSGLKLTGPLPRYCGSKSSLLFGLVRSFTNPPDRQSSRSSLCVNPA
jgi:hypothetical protein